MNKKYFISTVGIAAISVVSCVILTMYGDIKKSRQTMAYFKRSKDISLSMLEILADFYHMTLDYFRANGSFKANNVTGNNDYVGNVSVSTIL